MSPTAHELVARGAELLDSKLPGWADQIDLDSLELASSCSCVLGQLGGETVNLDALGWHGQTSGSNFGVMWEALNINPTEFGFDLLGDRDENGCWVVIVPFAELQDAWKQEIVARWTL